jgi:hypothetical protein
VTRTPRRRHLMLSAAALAAVILGGGLAVALPSHTPAPPGRAATATAGPAGTAGAGRPGQPQVPRVGLASVRWSDFYGVELPVSAQAGPRELSGGRAAGFARTPLGALLAAVNIAVRANAQWGPAIFTPVIRGQVTGPGAAALLAACQAAYDQAAPSAGVAGGQPLGTVQVTEQAFRWVTWTPAAAIIELVSAGPGPQGTTVRASTQIQAVWAGGDWKVIAPPAGNWGNSATELPSLRGYTVFPGQGGGR